MSNYRYTLLTGVTGLLGRYLVRDLTLKGIHLAVLVRSKATATAQRRLEALLSSWEAELGFPLRRPVCLEGDVAYPGLLLTREARQWVARHCNRALHSAASLNFRGGDPARDPWLSNYTGTLNVAAVCRESGIRELHHVSTAYVCGTRRGPITEAELDAGQQFRNDYEASKCAAETWLRRQAEVDSLTVYRPAVITGDWRTGYTSTYYGVYRFFQFISLMARQATRAADGRWDLPIRLRLTGDEPRNLIPVDWTSELVARLLTQPKALGKTFHLTPAVPARTSQVEKALADYFGYRGVSFVGPDGAPDAALSQLERLFYGYVDNHTNYLDSEPGFDSANLDALAPDLPCPRVDGPYLRRLIDFGVRDCWGKAHLPARRAPMRRVELHSR
jgi:nucleoside-diphosphate-sugar epimerase